MKNLSVPKKTLVIAGVIVLVVAISGTALAMLDAGQSAKRVLIERSTEPSPAQPANAAEPQGPVELSGAVDMMAVDGWLIGGQTVMVNNQTYIPNAVTIGTQVKVQAQRLADGSLVAMKIERDNSVPGRSVELGNANTNENQNQNENQSQNGNQNENENQNQNGNQNENENQNQNENQNENENQNQNENQNGNFNANENENHNGNMNNNENNDEHRTGNHNRNEHGDGDHENDSNSHGND
jgi:flagellar biosynthesis GTPase FlhF